MAGWHLEQAIKASFSTSLAKLLLVPMGLEWKDGPGRKGYKAGKTVEELGFYCWYGGQQTALFEFTGVGCQSLREAELLRPLIEATQERATRLDVAADRKTKLTPHEFVSAGYTKRVKSENRRTSDTGDTITLGSWKSDRFVNVYRYHPPHPRSDTLRVEWRLKRDYAKSAAVYYLAYDAAHVVAMCDNSTKFKHPSWSRKNIMEKLPTTPSMKTDAGTLHWLIKQVGPAIKRLVRQQVIEDPQAFFEEHFMPETDAIQPTLFKMEDSNE